MDIFAVHILQSVSGGRTLLLYGDLGSGKTTFTQSIARALGVRDSVTSPTFTIAFEYRTDGKRGISTLVHVDLYRLDDQSAATDASVLNVLEYAHESDRLTVIEWADRIRDVHLPHSLNIYFDYGKKSSQRIVTVRD